MVGITKRKFQYVTDARFTLLRPRRLSDYMQIETNNSLIRNIYSSTVTVHKNIHTHS